LNTLNSDEINTTVPQSSTWAFLGDSFTLINFTSQNLTMQSDSDFMLKYNLNESLTIFEIVGAEQTGFLFYF